jgi:hypothetical protein
MSLENMTEDERNSAALKRLFSHPEVGPQAKRLYKQVVPDAKFPDLELEDKINAASAAQQKEINELRDKVRMSEVMERRNQEHAKARAAGLDPIAVEKVITEEGMGSFDAAIKYMKAMNASAPATPASMTPIRMPDNMAEIQKDPRAWANKTAYEAINELVAKRGQG